MEGFRPAPTSDDLFTTDDLEKFGWPDPVALASAWSLLQQASSLEAGNVLLALFWPWPSPPILAGWAAGNILGIGHPCWRHLRIALLGGGRRQTEIAEALSVPLVAIDDFVRRALNSDGSSNGDHNLDVTALKAPLHAPQGHQPEYLSLYQIAPFAIARAGVDPVWRSPQDRFQGDWFGHLRKKARDYYRPYVARYCSPDSAPYFAFVTPQASIGDRRVRELEAIPGVLDLVVLDLSEGELSALQCSEIAATALRDLSVLSSSRQRPGAPLLVITGQPGSFLAIRHTLQTLNAETGTADADVGTRVITLQEKRIAWRSADRVSDLDSRVTARLVGTTVANVADHLWELSKQVAEANGTLSDALRDASGTLRLLARRATSSRIFMEKAPPREVSALNWMERRGVVLQTLRAGGAGGYEQVVEALVDRATTIAQEIFERTPTGMAFSDIAGSASSSDRVLFVVDSGQDAVFAQATMEDELTDPAQAGPAPEIMVSGVKGLHEALNDFLPTRLVLACRGQLIARLLLTQTALPPDIDIVVFPTENDNLAWILRQTERWTEFRPWHSRAAAISTKLPPTVASAEFSVDAERRTTHTPRRTGSSPSDFAGWYELDGGFRHWFADGTAVTVLEGREPNVKLARDLERGDLVFAMPEDLKAEIAAEFEASAQRLGMAPTQQAVRRYKQAVRQAVNGGLTTSEVLRHMREFDAHLSLPTEQTIGTWLSAGEHADDERPYAAGGKHDLARRRFVVFARVIGLPGGLADLLYDEIDERRIELRTGGRIDRSRFERLLFDPNDVIVHFGVPTVRVRALRRRALNAFEEVVDIWARVRRETAADRSEDVTLADLA